METNIYVPNLVNMLKHKEQSIESPKITKKIQGTPLPSGANLHTTRRPSRVEK